MSEQIEYVEFRFADILGRLKSMTVPCKPVDSAEQLKKDSTLAGGTSVDGSSVRGYASVESSDLRLVPDMDTLFELPYASQRTAVAMCFVRTKEGSEGKNLMYPLDSRGVMHTVFDNLLPGGKNLKVKIEPEFHFIT
ncbi:MAG: glutamine synthetase beta-grasp domain-containing protein, partial [Candidatus Hodarchaeota archaeon]